MVLCSALLIPLSPNQIHENMRITNVKKVLIGLNKMGKLTEEIENDEQKKKRAKRDEVNADRNEDIKIGRQMAHFDFFCCCCFETVFFSFRFVHRITFGSEVCLLAYVYFYLFDMQQMRKKKQI